MPYGGSVNQMVPSFLTATSLGEFRRLPLYESHRTSTVPSLAVRVTRRLPCSHVTSRPSVSVVLPLLLLDGSRQTFRPPASVHP